MSFLSPLDNSMLPGVSHGSGVAPARVLHFCIVDNDWWALLRNMREDRCPRHGKEASRTPDLGSDITGPCLGCGSTAVVEDYGAHPLRERDLRCPACKEGDDG